MAIPNVFRTSSNCELKLLFLARSIINGDSPSFHLEKSGTLHVAEVCTSIKRLRLVIWCKEFLSSQVTCFLANMLFSIDEPRADKFPVCDKILCTFGGWQKTVLYPFWN